MHTAAKEGPGMLFCTLGFFEKPICPKQQKTLLQIKKGEKAAIKHLKTNKNSIKVLVD